MKPRLSLVLGLAVAVLVAVLGPAEAALAQDAKDTGRGIGNVIQGIAEPIVFSLGGLTALGAFMRRDVGIAFSALVITVILGLFVTDSGEIALREFTDVLGKALSP